MYDIPFVRAAFPVLILYLGWWLFIENPWAPEEYLPGAGGLTPIEQQELDQDFRAAMDAKDSRKALIPLLRLQAAYPENPIYMQHAAQIYDELGDFHRSAQQWDNFLQYSPRPMDGCPQVAMAHRQAGEESRALDSFKQCWELDKQNPDAIFYYAHELERTPEWPRAQELYAEGVKLAPNDPDVVLGLARMEMRRGDVTSAGARAQHILAGNPADTDAMLIAALVHEARGDRDTARRLLEKAHAASPGYVDVSLALARMGGKQTP